MLVFLEGFVALVSLFLFWGSVGRTDFYLVPREPLGVTSRVLRRVHVFFLLLVCPYFVPRFSCCTATGPCTSPGVCSSTSSSDR